MEIKKFIIRLIILMLIVAFIGAGVAISKHYFQSNWTEDGIRGIRDGCLQLGGSTEFCECYTNEIISRITMKEFFEMTKNMKKSEAEAIRAKEFVDSVDV